MSDPAPLARYTHRLRRQRLVYFSIIAAIVVALGVVAGVAWSHGEIAHTTLDTAAAPPTVHLATPSSVPTKVWQTADRIAIGTPQWGGTVIVYGKHTVRGLNARTGAQTWSYSRSDRTVCTTAQLGGVTIAVYELAGNCDEVTAVDSGTGARKWTRTLDMDGMPVYGHPTFQTYEGSFDTFLATTGSVIYALDPTSGYNRWTYSHFGCTITGAALGDGGGLPTGAALISQNCTKPNCGKLKFCGRGSQLLLRNAYDGRDDKNATNPDRIIWNRIGNSDVPVSADSLISGYDARTGALEHLAVKDGRAVATTPLSPVPSPGAAIRAVRTTSTDLVWTGGITYAIRPDRDTPVWRTATIGPPTVVGDAGQDPPVLSTARITVPSTGGASMLDGATGRTTTSFSFGASAAGDVVYPLGSGFLVGRRDGTAAYS